MDGLSPPVQNALEVLDDNETSCKLQDPQLPSREDLLKTIITQMHSYRKDQDTYILTFTYDQSLAHSLLDFILKEQECCEFFDFTLDFHRKPSSITLKISSKSLNAQQLADIIEPMIAQ